MLSKPMVLRILLATLNLRNLSNTGSLQCWTFSPVNIFSLKHAIGVSVGSEFIWIFQQRSQNAEKVTHMKGKLLEKAVILFNCIPFQIETSLTGKNLLQVTFYTLGDLP